MADNSQLDASVGDASPEATIDLISRVHSGDQRALDQLISRYIPELSRWASGRLPADSGV
jgi:hypothetical protein